MVNINWIHSGPQGIHGDIGHAIITTNIFKIVITNIGWALLLTKHSFRSLPILTHLSPTTALWHCYDSSMVSWLCAFHKEENWGTGKQGSLALEPGVLATSIPKAASHWYVSSADATDVINFGQGGKCTFPGVWEVCYPNVGFSVLSTQGFRE